MSRLRLIAGHLSWRQFKARLDEAWSPITLLRDPVARTLSLYSFVTSSNQHPWYEEVNHMDLDQFLDWYGKRPHSVDQQCRFICGRADADLAMDTLRHAFMAATTLEHIDTLLDRVSATVEYPLTLPRSNVSRRHIDRSDLSTDTLRNIDAINHADQLLYQMVLDAGLVGRQASVES